MPEQGRIAGRLRWTVGLSVVAFAVLATVIAMALAQRAEDRLLGSIHRAYLDGQLDASRFGTLEPEQVPPAMHAALANHTGPMEVHLPNGRELMVYQPEADAPVHYFDISDFEMDGLFAFEITLPLLVAIGLLLVLTPTLLITNRLLRPLNRLVQAIAQTRPEAPPRIDTDLLRQRDEVGLLAAALTDLLQRVDGFVERERRFSRDASHELRTPVTVASGALDLLRRNPSLDPAARRALDRIARANDDMSTLIDAFLLLAREHALDDVLTGLPLDELVAEAIAWHQSQIERRHLHLDCQLQHAPELHAPQAIARIVIRNLVRNAISHSSGDHIQISSQVQPPSLRIDNACDREQAEQSARTGFGLSIVETCCRRLGWQLSIDHQDGHFTATVVFTT